MSKRVIVLIILAAAVRFVGITQLPGALNRDEAAIGYNAYSLLKTGKDEHGDSWPLNFKSIGDYKMPGYIYATILPVKLFGLNDFSIRIWSAVAGVVSVVMIYLITKNVVAAALMALNPWAIFYSRIGYEANLALALFLAGLWLVLRKKWWGYIFWLGSMLTYSSSLIFIPLFSLLFIKKFPKLYITIFYTIVVFFVTLLIPVSSQKANITVFSDPATIDYYNQTRTAIFEQNPLLARTWWNKYVYFGRIIAGNYLKTFSPQFLLTRGGGHPWHKIPNMGYFYWAEILLAISGLIYLFRSKHQWRWWLLAWLLIAPLSSAITIDAPHATRSLYLLPIIIILASLGVPKNKKILIIAACLYLANVVYFSYQYLVNYPKAVQASLPVGLKESIVFVKDKNISGKIYLTGIADSNYLYSLVYSQYDPAKFQAEAVWTLPDTAGLINAYKFGNFTIVDDLTDVINPAAVILPKTKNYQVILY